MAKELGGIYRATTVIDLGADNSRLFIPPNIRKRLESVSILPLLRC